MYFVIKGSPVILKNSKRITRCGGVISSAKVEAYRPQAVLQLRTQKSNLRMMLGSLPLAPLDIPINVKITSYGAWKRESGNLPDLSNLYQMPEDLLEQAGIIEDDNQIESHDGSRRICMCDTCPDRPLFKAGPNKGQPKPDCGKVKRCPHERVEIEIEAMPKDYKEIVRKLTAKED